MLYFEKYHGTGNDFIILNGIEEEFPSPEKLAQAICHKHFGIGADGLMIVRKSTTCDIKMDFYNADGSIAPMCGNGIRCFTKFVYDQTIINKPVFTVETLAGAIPVAVNQFNDSGISEVRVNLGKPTFQVDAIDVMSEQDEIINHTLTIEGKVFHYSVLFIGTLHTVIFVDNLDQFDVSHYGELIETLPLFPNRTNVNFVEVVRDDYMKVRTFERGVGLTLSCGTGACSASIIGRRLKQMQSKITVEVLGGRLLVTEEMGDIYLSGPATLIAKGYYNDGGIIDEKS